ncbi:MAG: ribosome small subunit-dependent GTPase A [Planctomycetota bacterium]
MVWTLERLGWNDGWDSAFREHGGGSGVPARICAEHRGQYEYLSEIGEGTAQVAGRLRHQAVERADYPAVGDWVCLETEPGSDRGVIHALLPRRNKLSRKVAGREVEEQIVAANVDVVFLLSSMNGDLNGRRLERFASAVAAIDCQVVVCLSKCDLREDFVSIVDDMRLLFPSFPVLALSAYSGQGLDALIPWLGKGQTVAMLGSSGVGKSTLLNRLLGHERQLTASVREADDRGRHTTTHREMIPLPQGAWLIDNPGIRELQLWDDGADVEATFEDIRQLAAQCRFTDCSHQQEPGCAVREAIESGELEHKRWENFEKMQREVAFMATRHDVHAQREQRKKWKKIHRDLKERYKFRNRD